MLIRYLFLSLLVFGNLKADKIIYQKEYQIDTIAFGQRKFESRSSEWKVQRCFGDNVYLANCDVLSEQRVVYRTNYQVPMSPVLINQFSGSSTKLVDVPAGSGIGQYQNGEEGSAEGDRGNSRNGEDGRSGSKGSRVARDGANGQNTGSQTTSSASSNSRGNATGSADGYGGTSEEVYFYGEFYGRYETSELEDTNSENQSLSGAPKIDMNKLIPKYDYSAGVGDNLYVKLDPRFEDKNNYHTQQLTATVLDQLNQLRSRLDRVERGIDQARDLERKKEEFDRERNKGKQEINDAYKEYNRRVEENQLLMAQELYLQAMERNKQLAANIEKKEFSRREKDIFSEKQYRLDTESAAYFSKKAVEDLERGNYASAQESIKKILENQNKDVSRFGLEKYVNSQGIFQGKDDSFRMLGHGEFLSLSGVDSYDPLREAANNLQVLVMEKEGIQNFSEEDQRWILTANYLLHQADYLKAHGQEEDYVAVLDGANIYTEVARGAVDGLREVASETLQGIVQVYDLGYETVEKIRKGEMSISELADKILVNTPMIVEAVKEEYLKRADEIANGDTYQRTKAITKTAVEIASIFATGGTQQASKAVLTGVKSTAKASAKVARSSIRYGKEMAKKASAKAYVEISYSAHKVMGAAVERVGDAWISKIVKPSVAESIPIRLKEAYLGLQNSGYKLGEKVFMARDKTLSMPGVWHEVDKVAGKVPVTKIHVGSKRVTVIGNNMGNGHFGPGVADFAYNLKSLGVDVNIFDRSKISKVALQAWENMRELNSKKGQYIPAKDIKNSLMFQENKIWLEEALKRGDTIVDLGELKVDKGFPSEFYYMEKRVLMRGVK